MHKKSEIPDQGKRSWEKVCCTKQDGKTPKKVSFQYVCNKRVSTKLTI
jgi:hypothetical protein